MSKVIDFLVGTDTGEADEDAIKPTLDGEKVFGSIVARPDGNLRLRTEVLRAEANYQRWMRDADQAVTYWLSTGTLTWGGAYSGGTGELVLSAGADLVVAPMYGPGESRSSTVTPTVATPSPPSIEGSGTVFPARYAYAEFDNGDYETEGFVAVSEKFDFEGGNEITITITGVANSGAIDVFVAGDGTVQDPAVQPGQDDIQVTYDPVLVHTVQDIVDAINADSVANQLVTMTFVGDTGSTAMWDVATTSLNDGIDGVYHVISDTNLAAFFAITTDNLLREGDILGIYYETPKQRRRSIEETAEETIPAASLVNLTAEPDKAPNSVVIGRVINDEFVLTNGVRMPTSVSIASLAVASDGIIRADYERPIASPPTPGTEEGSKRLGVDASVFTYLNVASESQQEVNEDVDSEVGLLRTDFEAGNASPPGKGVGVGSEHLGIDGSPFVHFDAALDSQQELNEAIDTWADLGTYRFEYPSDGAGMGLVEGDVMVSGYSLKGASPPGYGASDAADNEWVDLDHDGEFLAVLDQGDLASDAGRVEFFNITGGAVPGAFELTYVDGYVALAVNGSRWAAVRSNGSIEVGTYTAGAASTKEHDLSHSATIRDVWMDESRVYVCGDLAPGNIAVQAFSLSTGSPLWTMTRSAGSAGLYSITGDDEWVYVAGQSDAVGGEDLYRLNKSTGAVDDSISVGTATQETFGPGRLVVGPHSLFMATTSADPGNLFIYEVNKDGPLAVVETLNLSGETGGNVWEGNLDIDDRYLYVSGALTYLYAVPYRMGTLDAGWARKRIIGLSTVAGRVVTTGQYVHSIQNATSQTTVAHVGIGRKPGTWLFQRLDSAGSSTVPGATWFRRKFIPVRDDP